MSRNIILVADDEPVVHESLGIYLKNEGFEVINASDGKEALELLGPDVALCVLDIMMPGMSGIDVCKQIRKTSHVPIIMLTAKGEEIDRIIGLELGADDYIAKPFSPREVTARIKAVLRRAAEHGTDTPKSISVGGLNIDMLRYTVTINGEPIVCTPKEIEILYVLASSPGEVFSRDQLLEKIWGYVCSGETRTVDTHIKRIRSKIEKPNFNYAIKTIYGIGYKFEAI